jgi:hypothetical protein
VIEAIGGERLHDCEREVNDGRANFDCDKRQQGFLRTENASNSPGVLFWFRRPQNNIRPERDFF